MRANHIDHDIADAFKRYAQEHSTPGSNMPSSYAQAIHKLNAILKTRTNVLKPNENLWLMVDAERLASIYEIVKNAQRETNGGFFAETPTPSYWKQYFYSSAIKMLSSFLTLESRKANMLAAAERATQADKLARELETVELPPNPLYWDDDVTVTSAVGKERLTQIKMRENQSVFRQMILKNYRFQCCLCGLPVVETLRASHISPWATDAKNRLNPENGLCLSATFDAAFDRHLISFDAQYRLILSRSLREFYTNKAFDEQFKRLEGETITMPVKFLPSPYLLEKHREQLA